MVRLTEDVMVRTRIGRRYWHAAPGDLTGKPAELVNAYVDKFDDMRRRGVGVYLWGDNSVGKTHIACILGKEAMRRGCPVMFLAADELREKFIENVEFEEGVTFRARALSVPMLILDDLGKENTGKSSGWVEQTIENILRSRSRDNLLTVLTSNLSFAEFSTRYLKSAAELIRENTVFLEVVSDRNFRAEKSREALAALR